MFQRQDHRNIYKTSSEWIITPSPTSPEMNSSNSYTLPSSDSRSHNKEVGK